MISLLLVGAARAQSAQTGAAPLCNITDKEAAGLNVDASTDVHAMRMYRTTVSEMLNQGRFEQLDCLADHLRSSKQRFPGGMWKIHIFYGGLVPQQHATEEDWNALLSQLHKWASAKPQSVTALIALASAYEGYAWDARGNGYSDTVSESGWKLFEDRSHEALRLAEKAAALPTKCPEWYLVMLALGRDQGWSMSETREFYEEATRFEPGYQYYARMLAYYLLSKWSGEKGDSEKFTEEIANKIGGEEGDALYFQVATFTDCNCADDPDLSWARIVKGFQATEKLYGPSMVNLNLIAHMATFYNHSDAIMADQAIQRIGDQWDEDEWKTKDHFDEVKKWAATAAPALAQLGAMENEALNNAKTPEGAAYKRPSRRSTARSCRNALRKKAAVPINFRL